jgi:hypothetical protein
MNDVGAAPSIPASNGTFRMYPNFLGYAGDCATPTPYLLPPAYNAGKASELKLPLLFAGGSAQLSNGYSNKDFSLSLKPAPNQKPNQTTVSTEVSAGTAIWSCAAAARAELRANFADFLANVEALEGETLIPGATRRIATALAPTIPAAPAETLYFRYGLSTGLDPKTPAYVDVLPGMRLRVEAQASQYLSPGSNQNGYLPGGEIRAEVTSVPAGKGSPRAIAFDPFLATIRAPTVAGTPAVPTIAGGLVDLNPTGGARTHWRLFAPRQVGPPRGPDEATVATNFTLVGAPTYASLETATASYPNPPVSGVQPLYVIVLGRALVVPEIPIWITASGLTGIEHVRLGTTLTNVIERYTTVPLDPTWPSPVGMRRMTASGKSLEFSIFIDNNLLALTPELFDLPLIAGDSVTLPV